MSRRHRQDQQLKQVAEINRRIIQPLERKLERKQNMVRLHDWRCSRPSTSWSGGWHSCPWLELGNLYGPFQLKVLYDSMITPHILHPPVLLWGMMSQCTPDKHQVASRDAKVTLGKVDILKDKERGKKQPLILCSVPSCWGWWSKATPFLWNDHGAKGFFL